ncbi:MAG: DUF488 domain-containing protein [Actinobacteria bacterium HGW-Actinobacteria-8]|nr:MAG: DUF488 domain-containing protein [Actinobacteria bacterium HGW-Actinobacteria-8]
MAQEFALKRAYDDAAESDGMRVLVDRLWPRGLKRERAAIDRWAKEIAPSSDLRKWWHREPERFDEFAARYRAELAGSDAVERFLADTAQESRVTLVYAARNEERNHALVLLDVLRESQER